MKRLFLDIDTQIDFMFPSGALYVPGAEKLIPAIADLNRRAPVLISTMCEHSENDPEFQIYPPHCIAGTVGQRKPAATLVSNQILFAKQELNAFANPRLEPLLQQIAADEYVVYGVVTEICVQFAANKLLTFGKPVIIVEDAIRALNDSNATEFLRRFASGGGSIMTSAAL